MNLKKVILGRIQSGDAKMRPRWTFALQASLAFGGGFILALLVTYLTGLIVFVLRDSGVLYVTPFGLDGWYELLRSLPWVLILLCLAFVIGLEALVRRTTFAYKLPLLYVVILIVGFAALSGAFVTYGPVRGRIPLGTIGGHMPFIGSKFFTKGHWRQDSEEERRVYRGEVVVVQESGFGLKDWHGFPYVVLVTEGTVFYEDILPAFGDDVVVLGPFHEGAVDAENVRVLAR